MTDHEPQQPYTKQALIFTDLDGMNAQLQITTEDEAGTFLWAAQWLDEHREYFVQDVQIASDPSAAERDITRTLTLTLHHANTRADRRLGPWLQGVPPTYYGL